MKTEYYVLRDNKSGEYVSDIHKSCIEGKKDLMGAIRIPEKGIADSLKSLLAHYDVSIVKVVISVEDCE